MFTSFFAAVLGLRCCALASPVGVNEGYSLVGVNEGCSLVGVNEGYSLVGVNEGCSLVGVNEGYSLVEVRGLLIVLASLVLEHGP